MSLLEAPGCMWTIRNAGAEAPAYHSKKGVFRTVGGGRPRRDAGFDPVWGARPLKRAIQRELENPLAKRIVAGELREGDTIAVDADRGYLRIVASRPVHS